MKPFVFNCKNNRYLYNISALLLWLI